MRKKLTIVLTMVGLLTVALPLPASAIIHELVASHCAGHELPNNEANVDPPGQLNMRGNSFARALQATGIYDISFGVSSEGTLGLDTTNIDPITEEPTFGPMPAPAPGTTPATVVVDNTRPNAKLGDSFIWVFFVDEEAAISVYIQIYDLDHPAFDNCPNFHEGP